MYSHYTICDHAIKKSPIDHTSEFLVGKSFVSDNFEITDLKNLRNHILIVEF